jgi:hypothetical protein
METNFALRTTNETGRSTAAAATRSRFTSSFFAVVGIALMVVVLTPLLRSDVMALNDLGVHVTVPTTAASRSLAAVLRVFSAGNTK